MHKLSRTKRYTIWTKHQLNQEGAKKCDKKNGSPKYIKDSNQHKIESKVQRVNKAKPMSTR